jgi:hypothetical protein
MLVAEVVAAAMDIREKLPVIPKAVTSITRVKKTLFFIVFPSFCHHTGILGDLPHEVTSR